MSLRDLVSSVAGKFTAQNNALGYLAVKISSTSVLSTTWSVVSGNVTVGSVSYTPLTDESFKTLLHATDKVVSESLSNSSVEINQVVFAVPYHWIGDGKISQGRLKDLRAICKQLDLSPLGYVSLTEALESYYKEVEGAPLTAILVGIEGKNSTLTIYRAGKHLGTHFLGFSEYHEDVLSQGIEQALKKLNVGDILPSRIILYDGKSDLTRAMEKVTAYPWTARLPFLHFPKVETASAEFVVKAVAVAGALQQGGRFVVFDKNGDSTAVDIPFVPQSAPLKETNPISEEKAEGVSSDEEVIAETLPEEGIMSEEAIVAAAEEAPEAFHEQENELLEVSPEEAGFMSGSDLNDVTVQMHSPKKPSVAPLEDTVAVASSSFTEFPAATAVAGSVATPTGLVGVKAAFSLGAIVANLKKSLPSFSGGKPPSDAISHNGSRSASQMGGPKRKGIPLIALVVVVLAMLIGATGALAYLVPRAHIFVTVASQSFSHDLTVTVVTDKSSTSSGQVLVGSYVTTTEVGSRRAVATGNKLVGERAKGTVTIYNSSGTRTFPAGTVLTGNGFKFTTDSEVSVASGSGSAAQTTVNVGVTASDIGEKYNLPSGVLFSVGSLSTSSYQGKNEGAFSAGSSHQATVVTKDDQNRLLATLSAELTQQAQSALEAKVGPNETLLPKAITSTASKKKFTHDIDKEADTFGLDLTLDFKGVTFAKEDMVNLFKETFKADISDGYELSAESVQFEVNDATTDKAGNIVLKVHLSGQVVPKISSEEIATAASGKSVSTTTTFITKLPGVTAVRVEIEPKIASPIATLALPWNKDHITIDIVRE